MKIWIGGSSGLTQTYFNAFSIHHHVNDETTTTSTTSTYQNRHDTRSMDEESWILIGCERTTPTWIMQKQKEGKFYYIYCDLCQLEKNDVQRVMTSIQTALVQSQQQPPRLTSNQDLDSMSHQINSIIVGIRPPLVTHRTNEAALRYNNSVVDGLYVLLHEVFQQYFNSIRVVIHISSIAAINHIATQHLRSITTRLHSTTSAPTTATTGFTTPSNSNNCSEDPSYTELQYPYDRFKRQCEMMIEQLVQAMNGDNTNQSNQNRTNTNRLLNHQIQCTSVRLGAIFSDTRQCIQCTVLFLQLLFCGPYLPTHIDCNSSYNVCQLLHEILLLFSTTSVSTTSSKTTLRPIYYYTRCVSQYPYPVPYGEFLLSYKKAYLGTILSWFVPILIPHLLIEYGVVRLWHGLTVLLQMIHSQCRTVLPFSLSFLLPPPYLESIDYLLQVTLNEHTFDMKETIQEFPKIVQLEETMEECFRRRRPISN